MALKPPREAQKRTWDHRTVSVTAALCDTAPLVPAIEKLNVPFGVFARVSIVTADVPAPVTDGGSNVAVQYAGR